MLLREGAVGSDAFKQAVERELRYFEDELQVDLVRLASADGATAGTGAGVQGDHPAGVRDGCHRDGLAAGEGPGTGRTDDHMIRMI
jgi:hypothetical protein